MNTNTAPSEIQRLADQLRAAKAASLADPNLPTWRRDLYEAKPAPWWRTGEPKPVPVAARTRKRKPSLAGVARQAAKAGIEAAAYEYRPDGSIRIIVGKPVGGDDIGDTASPDPRWN